MQDMNDIFREEEERLLAEGRAAQAAEDAAWYALPQAERDRISEERAARFAVMLADAADDEAEDAEDDEGEDDDDE